MDIEYRFLTLSDIRNYAPDVETDPEQILKSGIDLYGKAVLDNPYCQEEGDKNAVCIALVDGRIVGRFFLFRSRIKMMDRVVSVQTGGGFFVSEQYRGLGIGQSLSQKVTGSDVHFSALFTRPAYNIFKKTESMLEIPQYVKYRYRGIKRILDLPMTIRQSILKNRFAVRRLSFVPDWAGEMAMADNHKYMEVHTKEWLQWALDHTSTGERKDYQSFYAIYNKQGVPVGFFMTKVRTISQGDLPCTKANLVEWASSDLKRLDEGDINILSLDTYDSSVSRFWTISESVETGKKLKRFSFKRRGWFAMSITRDKRFEDIGNLNQWRIRYGCCNTTLVE